MASQFEFPHNASLDRFERARAKLSDGVIGHVLPRGRAQNRHFGSSEPPTNPLKAHDGLSRQSDTLVTKRVGSWIPPHEPSTTASPVSVATNAALSELGTEYRTSCRGLHRIEDKATRIEMKKAIRCEQCRTNQARPQQAANSPRSTPAQGAAAARGAAWSSAQTTAAAPHREDEHQSVGRRERNLPSA
ncbi:hypothetical protein PR003_g27994 [Phytophthora rubi]|uniref:Uncharacterized protein n=1 Tax=Phytophthora rubi TaxID=129364 RepID=A0A6A4BXL7_9STRA|nr:hypothetical protein PR001_g26799 [Phytophthora rubi]KAE9280316.1 hypothetical protein PR003_g27994 [Phytophthora rubi]